MLNPIKSRGALPKGDSELTKNGRPTGIYLLRISTLVLLYVFLAPFCLRAQDPRGALRPLESKLV